MGNELEMTELQRHDLEQTAKYGHCWLVRRRAQALLLLGQGGTPAEVADILDTRRESIYQWRMNWRQGGMAGLAEGRHTGRPGALDEEQQAYLEQLADARTYSIRQQMTLMQVRYPGFSVHPSTMRRILRERGFRWKRTRYSLKKRPQTAYQQASEELAELAAAAARGEVDLAYFDESGFSVNSVLRYAWTGVGEQKAVVPQRHSRRFNVLGCLLHGELVWQGIWARVDAAAVIRFMNELVKRLRRRTILVLDNAAVHNCKVVQTWLARWRERGLEFYFLPPYSPELNWIEGLWRQVKYHWYPFREADASELESRIARILNARSDAYARNLTY